MFVPLPPLGFQPVIEDLNLDPKLVVGPAAMLDAAPTSRGRVLLCAPTPSPAGTGPERLRSEGAATLAKLEGVGDTLLFYLDTADGPELPRPEVARWRDALWPRHHVVAVYRMSHGGMTRRTLQGDHPLSKASGRRGVLIVARPRAAVFARDAVTQKFEQNASGWNGSPGQPGYAHFRWMRRFVGTFADSRPAKRILDFGCGAGWVGIEAALLAPSAELCAFDPSPALVDMATENARASGVTRFTARVGFGEEPPFPGRGEDKFDLVISSGVISFAEDAERFLDGLVATIADGGTLVIGDLNPHSRGMRKRRTERPLLPLRELNASTHEEVGRALERRGFTVDAWSGYQLSSPVPELMHWSARRAFGLLDGALLAWNRRAAGPRNPERFDSWVLRCTAPTSPVRRA